MFLLTQKLFLLKGIIISDTLILEKCGVVVEPDFLKKRSQTWVHRNRKFFLQIVSICPDGNIWLNSGHSGCCLTFYFLKVSTKRVEY